MPVNDLKQDLSTMPHLQDLKSAVDQEVTVQEPKAKKQTEKEQEEYTFDFQWKNSAGKLWKGQFTNKILTIRDRQLAGLLRARLSGGMPTEALDELTSDINLMVSHLSYSLVKRPDWAEDLTGLVDVRLLTEIYLEVLEHENTFRGYRSDQADS